MGFLAEEQKRSFVSARVWIMTTNSSTREVDRGDTEVAVDRIIVSDLAAEDKSLWNPAFTSQTSAGA
jgi:hypothetical protein